MTAPQDDVKKYAARLGARLVSGAAALLKTGVLVRDHLVPQQLISWNEKSVEYHYVRHILPAKATANPLAGDAETSFGDLITGELTGRSLHLCVVEFKRSEAEINDEFEKYLRTTSGIGTRPKGLGFQSWFAQANQTMLTSGAARSHFLIFGTGGPGADFKLSYGGYATPGSQELMAFDNLRLVESSSLALYLAQLARARVEPPANPTGGQAMVSLAKKTIAGQFNSLLLNSKGGYCGTADELLSLFEHWLDYPDENLRRHAMQEAVFASAGPSVSAAARMNELLDRAMEVTRLLQYVKAETALEVAHMHAGGRS